MTTIQLNDEQVKQFELFQKFYTIFLALLDAGVFETKNGQVVINFNHLGHMMNIEVQKRTYSSIKVDRIPMTS